MYMLTADFLEIDRLNACTSKGFGSYLNQRRSFCLVSSGTFEICWLILSERERCVSKSLQWNLWQFFHVVWYGTSFLSLKLKHDRNRFCCCSYQELQQRLYIYSRNLPGTTAELNGKNYCFILYMKYAITTKSTGAKFLDITSFLNMLYVRRFIGYVDR